MQLFLNGLIQKQLVCVEQLTIASAILDMFLYLDRNRIGLLAIENETGFKISASQTILRPVMAANYYCAITFALFNKLVSAPYLVTNATANSTLVASEMRPASLGLSCSSGTSL